MTNERTTALVEALAEATGNLVERFPGYHEQILKRLTKLVLDQDSYASDKARKKAIDEEVVALTHLVLESDAMGAES